MTPFYPSVYDDEECWDDSWEYEGWLFIHRLLNGPSGEPVWWGLQYRDLIVCVQGPALDVARVLMEGPRDEWPA